MEELRQWHRLFGMSWADFFTGLPVVVEMEKDLSLRQQRLDVVLIRKTLDLLPCRLPDGFEDLAAYNLISFKSYKEALDGWTLNELIGHYVNYRKQISPDLDHLLPEADFRLFAVSIRYPHNLAQQVELERVQEGVYQVRHFTGVVRVIVVHQLPQAEHNAMLHLFSAKAEQVRYGAEHYRPRSSQTSTFLYQLFERYQREGVTMSFTKEEFYRETIDLIVRDLPLDKRLQIVKDLPAEQRLQIIKALSAEERLQIVKGLPVEQRLQILEDLPAEERLQILKDLPAEQRVEGMSADELIRVLAPETLEAMLRRLKAGNTSTQQP